VVDRILAHVRLPLTPELLSDGSSVGFDVTDEPVPRWVVAGCAARAAAAPRCAQARRFALDMRREGAEDRARRGS
jgi:hypothetical protein